MNVVSSSRQSPSSGNLPLSGLSGFSEPLQHMTPSASSELSHSVHGTLGTPQLSQVIPNLSNSNVIAIQPPKYLRFLFCSTLEMSQKLGHFDRVVQGKNKCRTILQLLMMKLIYSS